MGETGAECVRADAAKAGVILDDVQVDGLARLKGESSLGHEALAVRLKDGSLGPEGYIEACATARREWLRRTREFVAEDDLVRMYGAEARALPESPDLPEWPYWMRRTVALGIDPQRGKHGIELIQAIMFLGRVGAYAEIDAVYARIVPSAFHTGALIAFLRTPFAFKERLCEWKPLRERVRDHLSGLGLDAPKLLKGLGTPEAEAPPVGAEVAALLRLP